MIEKALSVFAAMAFLGLSGYLVALGIYILKDTFGK